MYPCETMSFGYKQDSYLSRKKKKLPEEEKGDLW